MNNEVNSNEITFFSYLTSLSSFIPFSLAQQYGKNSPYFPAFGTRSPIIHSRCPCFRSRCVFSTLFLSFFACKMDAKRPIGNIPSFSYLEEKAFRHGDIEDIIANLFKAAGGGFLSRGTKFTPLDVKRVYL